MGRKKKRRLCLGARLKNGAVRFSGKEWGI